ncbi:RNA polymerase subunit sigma-24 [Kibdelosporangium aridum]|uniref:RNA polymerase subunit sigma-24 n=1 Tax=Kibdelosporangium aridum TaxID=2030 RepID=A0A428YZL3_KIBAR|nr:RNA polymerase subunit sigma-24 [Kibdelosporangium aridum]
MTYVQLPPEDQLRLMYTCCHPALSLEAQIALTLHTLAGLSTAEIARAFLVDEHDMAERLAVARRTAKDDREFSEHERTPAVLTVLYLLFNEGYSASRSNLADEAIRLARVIAKPGRPEALGLLALMLLHHARRDARLTPEGDLVTLDEQDRTQWNRGEIAEGLQVLDAAQKHEQPGPYQIQAAIAACHVTAPSASDTDWLRIAELYGLLMRLTPSPVVELNRAVAIGMADGPGAGLALVEPLTASLGGYHLLHATRADFLRRLGRRAEAVEAYTQALALTNSAAEKRYLTRRLRETGG